MLYQYIRIYYQENYLSNQVSFMAAATNPSFSARDSPTCLINILFALFVTLQISHLPYLPYLPPVLSGYKSSQVFLVPASANGQLFIMI